MIERVRRKKWNNALLTVFAAVLLLLGIMVIWAATLKVPDLSDLYNRQLGQSTKIYDRTGQILLYDLSNNAKMAQVSLDQISPYAQKATLAIEDKNFYTHGPIVLTSILRAFLANLTSLSFSQGGSTITQQVVKNTILNSDKTPTRKIKEIILAFKLEKALTKDQILNIYLNNVPYGGNIYGIEQAAEDFYGINAKDLDTAQSAYLAAMIQAPTYYSPYGQHKSELEARKNLVLHEMLVNKFINQDEYNKAVNEVVVFKPRANTGGLKAPHFVFFVLNYLAQKYGEDAIQNGGLKVITTLDYSIQQSAEQVAATYGAEIQKNFNASNNSSVVIDPKTGDILAMVGSRDYYDTTIDGNYNDATALRQPGSTFKPFVYSVLFNRGFTPSTILFDVPTQFNTNCAVSDLTTNNTNSSTGCYAPGDFDNKFRGPMTIRDALAQSINVPAVKAVYIAGVKDSIDMAHALGVTSLEDESRYGLSLVLGGGEVSLLDMTSAYSVFANDGVRNPYRSVLQVTDNNGTVLEQAQVSSARVLPAQTAEQISDVLSDYNAKTPAYGPTSPLFFADRQVASKTGTTNDSRDAWVIGYTPDIAVGVWAGNNDNSPMVKKVAGLILVPLWRALMDKILPNLPDDRFIAPQPIPSDLNPVLEGNYQAECSMGGYHDILYWVDKENPQGPRPINPASDPQFRYWEYGVQQWAASHPCFVPSPIQTTPNTSIPFQEPAQPVASSTQGGTL